MRSQDSKPPGNSLDSHYADTSQSATEMYEQMMKDMETSIIEGAKKGLKYDSGKSPMDLLDPLAIDGLCAVLEFGRKKYAAHNWRNGISYSRLIAALLRHSFAILRGEYTDPESGLPHIDHVGCCWMFMSNHMKVMQHMDDLYHNQKDEKGNYMHK